VENVTNQNIYGGADRDRTDCLRNAIAAGSIENGLNPNPGQVPTASHGGAPPGGTRNPSEAPSPIAVAGPNGKKNGKSDKRRRAATVEDDRRRRPRKATQHCTKCGRRGHNARQCPGNGNGNGNGGGS
jgi:hypothetical protein